MFNLLPEPEKKQIMDEYKARRMAIGLTFLFIVGLFSIASIFPSYVLSSAKVAQVESNISALKNSNISKESADLNSQLSKENLKLVALRPSKNESPIATLFQNIIAEKSTSIRINGFLFQRDSSTGAGQISVNGVARTREDLSTFAASLRKDGSFTAVDLPISSFTKDQNADFVLTINGSF